MYQLDPYQQRKMSQFSSVREAVLTTLNKMISDTNSADREMAEGLLDNQNDHITALVVKKNLLEKQSQERRNNILRQGSRLFNIVELHRKHTGTVVLASAADSACISLPASTQTIRFGIVNSIFRFILLLLKKMTR